MNIMLLRPLPQEILPQQGRKRAQEGCETVRKVPNLLTEALEGPHFGDAGGRGEFLDGFEKVWTRAETVFAHHVAAE